MKVLLCLLSLMLVALATVCVWLLHQMKSLRRQLAGNNPQQGTSPGGQPSTVPAEQRSSPSAEQLAPPPAGEPGSEPEAANVQADKPKRKIVVVGESARTREELARQLAADFDVLVAEDGRQGLDLVRDHHPALVVSGVRMPVMSGYELCHAIREDLTISQIPVILVSAQSERENIIYGLEVGAADYIVKPFDMAVMRTRILSILKRNQEQMDKVLGSLALSKKKYKDEQNKKLMDKVIAIIKKHLSDSEFSINDLCSELGMSRSSAFGKIKVLTGHGPNDLIKAIRLDEANELLLTHEFSVGEVAYRVGFSDPKYFSTCFKKQFGISPTKL